MIRIFSLLSIFAISMVFLGGGGIVLLTYSKLEVAKYNAATALAEDIAIEIGAQLQQQQQNLDDLAKNPALITALRNKDKAQLYYLATKFKQDLPGYLKLRFLFPNVSEIDETDTPHMGYADLQMVQQTLKHKMLPTVQGQTEHRHLAMTALVKSGNNNLGVILASLNFELVDAILEQAHIKENFFEIQQSEVMLATSGNILLKSTDINTIEIIGSTWKLAYWSANVYSIAEMFAMLGIFVGASIFLCIALFYAYFQVNQLLSKDQAHVLQAVKDLMTGKELATYPVNLAEMKVIISTLIKFKRILDNKQVLNITHEDLVVQQNSQVEIDDSEMFNSEIVVKKKKSKDKKKNMVAPKKKSLPAQELPVIVDVQPKLNVSQKMADRLSTHTIITEVKKSTTENIFRVEDIRGLAGESFSKEVAYDIGLAVGTEVQKKGGKTIVVARDARLSSLELMDGLKKGIVSTGCHVLDLGLGTIPLLFFVAYHMPGRSGVMLTGSHSPAKYNGVKILIQGKSLVGDRLQKLKKRIEDEDYITQSMGRIEENTEYIEEYIGTLVDEIKISKAFKIVVDCGNGAASILAPQLFKALGCEVIELFCEVDGNYPNHYPDPSKLENLQDLSKSVVKNSADLGVAFDDNADRIGVVDANGKIILADRIMMLFVKSLLSKKPGAEIIYDVKCSSNLAVEIKKHGGRPVMWKSGHARMKSKLKKNGAVFAGEMTGHLIFNDCWFNFDDALYTGARLIETLSKDGRNSSEIFADFPVGIVTPEMYINMQGNDVLDFILQLKQSKYFSEVEIIDIEGLRIEFKEGWCLIRASKAIPSLSILFEANTKEALKRIQKKIKSAILEINVDIKVPF